MNPGRFELDEEEGHAARAGGRIRLRRQNDDVAELAVRDEDLLTVDQIVIAVAPGLGAYSLEIAARVGLGHAKRTDRLAPNHFRQPVSLLLFGAERENIGRDKVGVDEEAGAARAHPPKLLEDHDVEQIIETQPAIFLRDRATEQALRSRLQP